MENKNQQVAKTNNSGERVTETQKPKTIAEAIDKRVNEYKSLYETLVECGNKKPASVIIGEAWINEQYIGEKVVEELKKIYQKEIDKEYLKEVSK